MLTRMIITLAGARCDFNCSGHCALLFNAYPPMVEFLFVKKFKKREKFMALESPILMLHQTTMVLLAGAKSLVDLGKYIASNCTDRNRRGSMASESCALHWSTTWQDSEKHPLLSTHSAIGSTRRRRAPIAK